MKSAKLMSLKLANLLDTESYGFIDRKKIEPEYFHSCAILSHRWQGEEIQMRAYEEFVRLMAGKLTDSLIDDIMEMDKEATVKRLEHLTKPLLLPNEKLMSIAKILRFCRKARRDGYSYAWVDTCCIDKDDTTATSKAIGSMWDYYSLSSRCYVYLSDVSVDGNQLLQQFKGSEWFTRGWTLQELMASYKSMGFYDCRWRPIQLGPEVDLPTIISDCTNITPHFLQNPDEACVAVKMSWLSGRETRFDEDMAYCMLGIFGVQLQVHYGEGGENAFRRLQMVLIEDARYRNDESIFAWIGSPEGPRISTKLTACGLLAPWPSHFARSGRVSRIPDNECKSQLNPKILANRDGIEIQIPVKHMHINNGADMNIAEAAKSNQKEIFLNVREDNTVGDIFAPSLLPWKKKRGPRSNKVALTLIKNPEKQWRRQPTDDQIFREDPKGSKNTMPLFIPHLAASDTAADLRIAKRGGFMDGMKAAIEAQKG